MLNPVMLLGLLGLTVPIIIHLINRRRLEPRLLSTLRFLDQEDVANAFQPVPRDLLQLLLRLVLLALFVLLLARMTASQAEVGPRTLAMILDASMSMQRKLPGGQTLFERQKGQVRDLLDGMKAQRDLFSLLLVGDRVFVDTGYSRDPERLRAALDAFQPTDGAGRALPSAIERSLEELENYQELNTALLVFSDHQKTNFRSVEKRSSLPGLLARGRTRLLLVTEPLEPAPNLCIESARFFPPRVHLGGSSKMTAAVRNASDSEQTLDVSFAEGESAGETRSLTLQPGETAQMDLVHVFESPIDTPCKATLSDDVLPADNAAYSPMRMKERRQVLLVVPPKFTEQGEVQASTTGVDLLSYAINPEEALGLAAGVHTVVKRITPNLLERASLSIYSSILIYNLTELPAQSLLDLQAYVENGGGLCLILDSKVSPFQFNETYQKLLSPFQLGALKQPSDPVFLDRNEANLGSPVLLPLVREEWGKLDEIHFLSYFGVENRGNALCALRASQGDWLAAAIDRGRGRIYVQLFACDIRETSFPRTPAFVPMVQEILAFLARETEGAGTDALRAGESRYLQLPEFRGLGGEVELRKTSHRFSLPADGRDVKIENLYAAGNYEITHAHKKTARTRWVAVNPASDESDLAPLAEEDLHAVFGTSANVAQLAFADLPGRFARRQELFSAILALVFAAFLAETLLGAWQSRRKEAGHE